MTQRVRSLPWPQGWASSREHTQAPISTEHVWQHWLREEPDTHGPPSCGAFICPLRWGTSSWSIPDTHQRFPLPPQPPPQCNGPPATGKQEAEVWDRGEEAEIRAPKVVHQSPGPKQTRAHTKGETVWHLGLEGDHPGHEAKDGCHQVCRDSPLFRYVCQFSFATYYGIILVPQVKKKKKKKWQPDGVFQEISGLGIQIETRKQILFLLTQDQRPLFPCLQTRRVALRILADTRIPHIPDLSLTLTNPLREWWGPKGNRQNRHLPPVMCSGHPKRAACPLHRLGPQLPVLPRRLHVTPGARHTATEPPGHRPVLEESPH